MACKAAAFVELSNHDKHQSIERSCILLALCSDFSITSCDWLKIFKLSNCYLCMLQNKRSAMEPTEQPKIVSICLQVIGRSNNQPDNCIEKQLNQLRSSKINNKQQKLDFSVKLKSFLTPFQKKNNELVKLLTIASTFTTCSSSIKYIFNA